MFDVSTDYQVIPFGDNKMGLYESDSGDTFAIAEREDGEWTITADDVDDKTADSRSKAIDKLKDLAMESLDTEGFSVTVPKGLREQS